MGRFLQTDPIGQADDPNLYAYVKDDPVDRSDPTGLIEDDQQRTGSRLQTPGGEHVAGAGGSSPGAGQPNSRIASPIPLKNSSVPPATGKLQSLLQCVATKCSDVKMTITSTHEKLANGKHGENTPHGRGEAADIRVGTGPQGQPQEGKVLQCAADCGARFGLDERRHPQYDGDPPHAHVQLGAGTHGGPGDLPPAARDPNS